MYYHDSSGNMIHSPVFMCLYLQATAKLFVNRCYDFRSKKWIVKPTSDRIRQCPVTRRIFLHVIFLGARTSDQPLHSKKELRHINLNYMHNRSLACSFKYIVCNIFIRKGCKRTEMHHFKGLLIEPCKNEPCTYLGKFKVLWLYDNIFYTKIIPNGLRWNCSCNYGKSGERDH